MIPTETDPLRARARATPTAEALVHASSGHSWDYEALDEAVDATAGQLAALGVKAGDHLGVVMGPRIGYVKLIHAARRLGAVLVPISDRLTAPELTDRIDRADVTTLVCDGESEPIAVDAADDVALVSGDPPKHDEVRALSGVDPAEFTHATMGPDDTQLLLFTSGTSGTPKVVPLTVGNLQASAISSSFRLGVDPDDRWLVTLSLHHMGGIAPILRSVLYGTSVVLREGFDPGPAVDDIDEYDVTAASLVPNMLQRMLSTRGTLPGTLRFVLLGGAPAPRELLERCRGYSVPVCPTYGMTETASQVATARPDEAAFNPGTVGGPLLWTDVTIVDDEGDPLEAGETGEVVVSGPTVAPEYYDAPEDAEGSFGPQGLHTGDAGYLDESGRLYVTSRLDDRIVTGGETVDPGEIVDVLQGHQSVAEAAVVGLADDEWGEQVAALIVPGDEELSQEDLESYCRDRLAGFKIPRRVRFADALPRTVSGTIDRDEVRDLLVGEADDEVDVSAAESVVAFEFQDDGPTIGDEGSDESDSGSESDDEDLDTPDLEPTPTDYETDTTTDGEPPEDDEE